ncbi:MAG: DUF4395 domain-containing protein, partial [Actinobacteria bacterium]|nr:DUF4395 domain-containing protein [Actinomycetota bacterium]
ISRAKAFFHAVLPALAFLLGYPAAAYILGFTGLAMAVSVSGPRYSLFGRTFKAVRPALKIGPGRKEAVAPHRFAEAMGAVMLLAAALLYPLGAHGLAEVLALLVMVFAALNAAAGVCVGCQMYLLFKRFQPGAAG